MTPEPSTFGEDRLIGTGEAARILGVSSSSVVNLCKEGDLPFILDHRDNRRIRQSAVEHLLVLRALETGSRRLDPEERLALWVGYAVAGKVVSDTDAVLESARQRLAALRISWAGVPGFTAALDEWQRLIDEDMVGLLAALTSATDEARSLRMCNPFGEIIDNYERGEIAASFRDYIEYPKYRRR